MHLFHGGPKMNIQNLICNFNIYGYMIINVIKMEKKKCLIFSFIYGYMIVNMIKMEKKWKNYTIFFEELFYSNSSWLLVMSKISRHLKHNLNSDSVSKTDNSI